MKKTLAILLSVVLVVAAVFALTLTASADEVKVTSVTLTLSQKYTGADGNPTDAVVLNAENPVFTGSEATGTTGKATFDAEKGELTIEDLTGVKKIYAKDGTLDIVVKGTNAIESTGSLTIHNDTSLVDVLDPETQEPVTDPDTGKVVQAYRTDVPSDLLIKGDGVLNIKATEYCIISQTGSFEVTDKVTLNIEATKTTGNSDAIHVSSYGSDMTFSGDSVVNAVSHGMSCIRQTSLGTLTIKDNAVVNATVEDAENWATAVQSGNFKMVSGELNAKITGADKVDYDNVSAPVVSAIAINGKAENLVTAEFLGGKVTIDVGHDCWIANRLHAFYLMYVSSFNLAGTDIDIAIDTPVAGQKEAGVITSEYTNKFVLSGGTINVDAPNTTALVTPRNVGTDPESAAVTVDVSNVTLKGQVASFINTGDVTVAEEGEEQSPYVSAIKVKFDKSAVAELYTASKVLGSSSAKIVTVDTNASFCNGMDISSSAYAMVTGISDVKAITVSITPSVGADIYLNAAKCTLTEEEAKKLNVPQDSIVYDPYKATVTLNNMKGDVNRIATSGDVTFVVKGENTITMSPKVEDSALNSSGTMTVTGDGSLTVSGTKYVVLCSALMSFEGDVKIKVISHSTNAIHVAKNPGASDARTFVVGDNVQLDILATNRGIYLAGSAPTVQITDNAKVTIAPMEETMNQGIYLLADLDDGTGSQDAVLEVSGNASLKIANSANGVLFGFNPADEENPDEIAEATAVNAIVNISDNANVDIATTEQGIYYNSNKTNNTAALNVTDKAVVKVVSDNVKNKGDKVAAIQMTSPKNIVTMTTTGTVDLSATTGGWRGAFYMTGKDYDVVIKDTTLNVTNISESVCTTKNFNNEVSNAINFDCTGTGSIVLAGKAVVTAYAEKNGEDYSNRAHGLFLHPDHVLTVQDDATFNTTASGDSKASTGAGIHLKESSVVVKDNGKMNVVAKGTAVAGITFEGVSSLTVEGSGTVTIKGEGEDVVGVRSYNRSAKGVIEVKNGTASIELTGDPAVSTKNRKITINSASMKTGDTKKDAEVVEKITGKEGYVLLMGKNPATSDLSIAPFVIVAMVAIAATAAVILRKKYND